MNALITKLGPFNSSLFNSFDTQFDSIFDNIMPLSLIILHAVSSQDVSMPRIYIRAIPLSSYEHPQNCRNNNSFL